MEDLSTDDFVRSAQFSSDVGIDHSEVISLKQSLENGSVTIGFSVGKQKIQVKKANTLRPFREHSPMGEVSLYGWPPVLQVWIQLLHSIQKHIFFLGQVQSCKTGDQLYSYPSLNSVFSGPFYHIHTTAIIDLKFSM